MCLVVVALDAHPRYALVVAANRDEFHARAARPAQWGEAAPFARHPGGARPHGGRHLAGRAARRALGARHQRARTRPPRSGAPSRGALVPAILNASRRQPQAALATLRDADRYNGFNVLAGTATARPGRPIASPEAQHAVARRAWTVERAARHAVAEAHANPGRGRRMGRARRRRACLRCSPRWPIARRRPTTRLPATGVPLERERLLSAPFIVSDDYGTRCSTVLAIDAKRRRALRRALVRRATARCGEVGIRVRGCAERQPSAASRPRVHRPVRNARLQIFVARRREPMARVERHRVRLRVEHRRARGRACARAPSDAQAAPHPRRGPATRPAPPGVRYGRRAAAGRSRSAPVRVLGERVTADRVVIVPLQVFGDALLDDEHGAAHGAQRASRDSPPSRPGGS